MRGNGSRVEPVAEPIVVKNPGTLGAPRPPLLNLGLFVLTFASAFLSGSFLRDTQLPMTGARDWDLFGLPVTLEVFQQALSFSAALLFIMLCHEMGHFVLARRHRVDATWPFFIPAPGFSIVGTLGAVIKLRSLPRTRGALLDIGAAGPIAGFLATIPVLAVGLKLSTVVPLEGPFEHWTLFEAIVTWFRSGHWPPVRDAFDLGSPLGMELLQRLVVGPIPDGMTLALHPVAVAGWFGFLLTSLNLLPLGQLDGGHVLYGASPRLHRMLGPPLAAGLLALGVFTSFSGWILWGLLMGLGLGVHPPLEEPEEKLDRPRKGLVLASLVLFALSFCPVPLALLAG
jgi:membrane-associated protease RseP (regulator of RpoE activity)